jgi:hypothetical protein
MLRKFELRTQYFVIETDFRNSSACHFSNGYTSLPFLLYLFYSPFRYLKNEASDKVA